MRELKITIQQRQPLNRKRFCSEKGKVSLLEILEWGCSQCSVAAVAMMSP